MSELVTVRVSSIDPNPMRKLKRYPYDQNKIDALRQSIRGVGLWEGVIGRKAGSRYEQAFGHHRVQAARLELGENAKIALILRDLSDKEMLQFMGRENLEDYNANFLVMLETWEAALGFYGPEKAQNMEAIEVAMLLGWTRPSTHGNGKPRIAHVASACSAAARLIRGGYIGRDDLRDLTVHAAEQLCNRMVSQQEMIDRMARRTERPAKEAEQAKKAVGRAGKDVARDVRQGRVADRDIGGRVDVGTLRESRQADKPSPLFKAFARNLLASLDRMLDTDITGEKLREVKEALKLIETDEDLTVVSDLSYVCGKIEKRAAKWKLTFENPTKRVVKLKEIG